MSSKLTLQIYSGYSLLMGLAFLFMASSVIESVGGIPTPLLVVTQQIWGIYIIGVGAIAWFMSGTENADFFKGLVVLTGLVVIVTLYHIFAKGFGAPPLYVNTLVNAAVCFVAFTKMR